MSFVKKKRQLERQFLKKENSSGYFSGGDLSPAEDHCSNLSHFVSDFFFNRRSKDPPDNHLKKVGGIFRLQ